MSLDPNPASLICASRRSALGIAGGGAVLGALSACGGGSGDDGGAAPEESGSPAPEGDGALAKVDDIPVGGGTVFEEQKVVVTRPEEGTVLGFSAECTHKGCLVDEVADGQIRCPCHQSHFAVADGSVTSGPAEKPLPKVELTVEGDRISLA